MTGSSQMRHSYVWHLENDCFPTAHSKFYYSYMHKEFCQWLVPVICEIIKAINNCSPYLLNFWFSKNLLDLDNVDPCVIHTLSISLYMPCLCPISHHVQCPYHFIVHFSFHAMSFFHTISVILHHVPFQSLTMDLCPSEAPPLSLPESPSKSKTFLIQHYVFPFADHKPPPFCTIVLQYLPLQIHRNKSELLL